MSSKTFRLHEFGRAALILSVSHDGACSTFFISSVGAGSRVTMHEWAIASAAYNARKHRPEILAELEQSGFSELARQIRSHPFYQSPEFDPSDFNHYQRYQAPPPPRPPPSSKSTTPETKENLRNIATENAEALYEEFGGAEALWVTNDDLPSGPSEFSQRELKTVLSPTRLDEVLDGRPATEAELQALRDLRLKNILSGDYWDEEGDIPGYCLAEVGDAEGNTAIALILCTGTSLSGLTIWVVEIFDTRETAKAYLEENGWTSQP